MPRGLPALPPVPVLGVSKLSHTKLLQCQLHMLHCCSMVRLRSNVAMCLQEGAAAPAPAASMPRGLPALPAIPALGLYELPQIELPRNWLDIFAPLPAPKPQAPASAPEPVAPIQYDQLPALPARNRKMLQMPGYQPAGQQVRPLRETP